MSWRPEFEAALHVFASVTAEIEARGFAPPILVGGAAVELYSQSVISTGDFDIVTARDDLLEAVLREHGFVRPSGPGLMTRGWIHPDLKLGFEVVGSLLLDGKAEHDRVRLIAVSDTTHFVVIGIEDLIADRMGQFHSGSAPEMRDQARGLFDLYHDLDERYLERRIREETLDQYGIDALR